MKFVLYFDYRISERHPHSEDKYVGIEAKDLEEAIEMADSFWDKESDALGNPDCYLMRIMKKVGKIETAKYAGYKYETFEAVLCRRSYGWHLNNAKNSEGKHVVNKCWDSKDKTDIWYDIAG